MSDWKPSGSGVWVREYPFRGNSINSSAIDMGTGGLMVVSPGTNVPESDFAALDRLGTVKALVAPGSYHHMGLPEWSARYPEAGLFGPTSAIAHVAGQHRALKALQPLDVLQRLLSDEFVLEEVNGCKHPDLFLALTRGGAVTWFTNELISNNATYPKSFVFRTLFRLNGDHPGLNVSRVASMLIRANRRSVRTYLEGKLASVPPTRLVPCHGEVLDDPELGRKLAEILARRF